jgi:hypothetical protein
VCTVGTVGYSVGVECAGGRGSVVTCWGRIGRVSEYRAREWMGRGKKSSWEGEQWIVAQEKEGK